MNVKTHLLAGGTGSTPITPCPPLNLPPSPQLPASLNPPPPHAWLSSNQEFECLSIGGICEAHRRGVFAESVVRVKTGPAQRSEEAAF